MHFVNLRICSTIIMTNTFVWAKRKCIIETVPKSCLMRLSYAKIKEGMFQKCVFEGKNSAQCNFKFIESEWFNDHPAGYDCQIFDIGLNYIRWNKTFLSKNCKCIGYNWLTFWKRCNSEMVVSMNSEIDFHWEIMSNECSNSGIWISDKRFIKYLRAI